MSDVDLTAFDWIVVNTSAGKDSQTTLDVVVHLARAQGVFNRVVAVHADLGRMEWKGTRDLAEHQARLYGVRFEVVRRERGDLLAQVSKRGKWPDRGNRYCTSDQKRDQITKLFTRLSREATQLGRRVRILNCMGMRAGESRDREKLAPLALNRRASNGRRTVLNWLPIHAWSANDVWGNIKRSGIPHHPAYDLGMPRLSCIFCVFSSRPALILAGKHNPELLADYVAVEKRISHRFRNDQSIAEIAEAIERGEEPGPITTWEA